MAKSHDKTASAEDGWEELSSAGLAIHDYLDSLIQAEDPDGDAAVMDFTEFDGFIAGVVTCPEPIAPDDWLPRVCGLDDGPPAFDDPDQANRIFDLMKAYHDEIAGALVEGGYAPALLADDASGETLWEPWVLGFEAAIGLRLDAWSELMGTNKSASKYIVMLMELAGIARRDSSLDKAEIEKISGVAHEMIVPTVEYLHACRMGWATQPRQVGPKTGRNDPCPCGSGRKYKKCCGAGAPD